MSEINIVYELLQPRSLVNGLVLFITQFFFHYTFLKHELSISTAVDKTIRNVIAILSVYRKNDFDVLAKF